MPHHQVYVSQGSLGCGWHEGESLPDLRRWWNVSHLCCFCLRNGYCILLQDLSLNIFELIWSDFNGKVNLQAWVSIDYWNIANHYCTLRVERREDYTELAVWAVWWDPGRASALNWEGADWDPVKPKGTQREKRTEIQQVETRVCFLF